VLLGGGPLATRASAQSLTAADSSSLAHAAAATVMSQVLPETRGMPVELLAPASRFDSLVARQIVESGRITRPAAVSAEVVQVGTRGLLLVSDTPAVMVEVTRCDGRGRNLNCWSSLDSYWFARDGARWKPVPAAGSGGRGP
jgi:hypothetical protein